MEFFVNVIAVKNLDNEDVSNYLNEYASHITGCLYAWEGDLDCIDTECLEIDFDTIDENVIVPSLGGQQRKS